MAEHFQEGLPSDVHLAALSAEPAAAAVAAQHHALLLALQRCTASVLGSQPGGARGLFRQLIAIAAGASKASLRPHVGALLQALEEEMAPAVFLAEELGGPMQSAAAQVSSGFTGTPLRKLSLLWCSVSTNYATKHTCGMAGNSMLWGRV